MEHTLQRYGDWAPTGFDAKGAFLYDEMQNWLVVPVIRTRDSGVLAVSNFECAAGMISDASVMDNELSMETHRFGHWGPGWFEIIIVRPGSNCEKEALKIAKRLEDYLILDEDDYTEREWEYVYQSWRNMSIRERAKLCVEHGISIFAARHDYIPDDDNGHLWEDLRREY